MDRTAKSVRLLRLALLFLVGFAAALLVPTAGMAQDQEQRFKQALTHYANLEDAAAVRILNRLERENFALAATMLGVLYFDPLFGQPSLFRTMKSLRRNAGAEHKYAPFLLGFYSYVFGEIRTFRKDRLEPREYIDLFRTSFDEGHPNAPLYLFHVCRFNLTECDDIENIDEIGDAAADRGYLPDDEYAQFIAQAYRTEHAEEIRDAFARVENPSDPFPKLSTRYQTGQGRFYPDGFIGVGLLSLLAGHQFNRPDLLAEGYVDIVVGQSLSALPIYSWKNYLNEKTQPLVREALSQLSESDRRRLEEKAELKLRFLAHDRQPELNPHAKWCFSNFDDPYQVGPDMVRCIENAFDDGMRCETPAIVSDFIGRENRTRYNACRKLRLGLRQ